ncbi:MAG: efflux RND transporter periplasmic adaptor subunit, partial [Planctomycetota bacterium]
MLINLAPLAALLLAQDGAPPPTPVRAVRAREEVVVARQRVTGSARPALDARITARETGALVGAVPRLGDVVEEGAPLVTVDDRRLRAELTRVRADRAEAEAALARARAELAEATRDLEALRAARAGDAVSEREVRVALARRDVAAAGEAAAAARIEALDADAALLELRVSDTVVRAPFDGVVVERLAEVGEWVSPGDPVVRVVATATVEIWLDVPERLLAGVRASDGRFEARVPSSGLRVPLEDARVLPLVDRASRTFRIVGRSVGAGLAPGMSVEAEVPTGERAPWTLVPKDALKYR